MNLKRIVLCLILIPLVSEVKGKGIINKSEGSITFVVDNNVKPLKTDFSLMNGEKLANTILSNINLSSDEEQQIIATSFATEQQIICTGHDAFFKSVVTAYANHLSLTLTPDMVWLLICQGLSRYVNDHAEQLRPLIVNHTGKTELEIESEKDILSGNANWATILNGLTSQIDKHTNNEITKIITSGFSTTTPPEHIASQVTLMEIVKHYFNYTIDYVACGIPSITLKGTPEDWRCLLEKTRYLEKYGLSHWTNTLEPILDEFIKAAEGQPNQKFWKNMVRKKRARKLKDGYCGPGKTTELDGWILKLFPDENGITKDKIPFSLAQPSELLCVEFTYRIVDPSRNIISESPMELMAGFIGAEIDTAHSSLTPKIGWLVLGMNYRCQPCIR